MSSTSPPDPWGLHRQPVDPPPADTEIGVTTDGENWAPPAPQTSSSTTPSIGGLALIMIAAGGMKARTMILRHGWHRRKH